MMQEFVDQINKSARSATEEMKSILPAGGRTASKLWSRAATQRKLPSKS